MAPHPFVPPEDEIRRILERTRSIAVVGLSDNPMRPSHGVTRYMKDQGYEIVPINPGLKEIWGLKSYPSLAAAQDAGHEIDLVNVFRRPDAVMPVVDEAIATGARAILLQEGVINEDAAAKAEEAGLDVIMDRCIYKLHARLVK